MVAEHRGTPEGRAAFDELLARVRGRVDARLDEVLGRARERAALTSPDALAMAEAVLSLTMRGGKRFRPALVAAAHAACGGDGLPGCVVEAGVALELLQTYLLIHDDWMDGDDTRRGGPSVHAMLRTHFASRDRGDHVGILAGDFASALAQQSLFDAAMGGPSPAQTLRAFAEVQIDVVLGQVLDVVGKHDEVALVHDLKTTSYTVRGPLRLGATLSPGCRDEALSALDAYARPLGLAFQLRDDLLGVVGRPEQTGKPRGNDLRAGRRTAVVIEALSRLEGAGREALLGVLGRAEASEAAVAEAIGHIEASGAVEAIEARLSALAVEACSALHSGALTLSGREALEGAASALSARAS